MKERACVRVYGGQGGNDGGGKIASRVIYMAARIGMCGGRGVNLWPTVSRINVERGGGVCLVSVGV